MDTQQLEQELRKARQEENTAEIYRLKALLTDSWDERKYNLDNNNHHFYML